MTDDITDTWLGRAIREACADVARELNEERPWVCHHNDPSCRRGGYRCSDSCGPTRENQEPSTRTRSTTSGSGVAPQRSNAP